MAGNMFFSIFYIFLLTVCTASHQEQYRVPKTCTDKWETYSFKDKEYIIQNFPLKWEDAKILCRGHLNGTLAIVDTLEKAEFLVEAITESQFDLESIWVGARRSSIEDPIGYSWLDIGVPLRRTPEDVVRDTETKDKKDKHYPMWLNRTSVPVPEGGADCVAVDRINHDQPVFLDLACQLERPFVCERDSQPQSTVSDLRMVRCKDGFYHVFNGKMTWDQAAAFCVLKKMSLANIGSNRCMKRIGMTMLKMRPSIENAWVGARGENGNWAWIDSGASIFVTAPSSDSDDIANWPPFGSRHHPEIMKQNGCLQLDRHASHSPVFLEARCERKIQFICYQGTQYGMKSSVPATLPPSDDNYYYVLVRQSLFWQNAYENCLEMNGTLAKIESNEIMIQLLLLMGENKEEPVDHIWVSGKLNVSRDVTNDITSYTWYNPSTNKRIPDPKSKTTEPGYMPPWLDDDFSADHNCLNLDRQNHMDGLVYGMECDTPQYSICMIEKLPTKISKSDEPEMNMEKVSTKIPKADELEINMEKVPAKFPKADEPEINIEKLPTKIPKADELQMNMGKVPTTIPKADELEMNMEKVPTKIPKADELEMNMDRVSTKISKAEEPEMNMEKVPAKIPKADESEVNTVPPVIPEEAVKVPEELVKPTEPSEPERRQT